MTLLKLYSPVSFYFSNVATRKFKIANVASICGSYYLSVGQRCYRDIAVIKKDKSPSRMKSPYNKMRRKKRKQHWESPNSNYTYKFILNLNLLRVRVMLLLIFFSLVIWETLKSLLAGPYVNTTASMGRDGRREARHWALFPALPLTAFVALTKSPHPEAQVSHLYNKEIKHNDF